MCRWGQCLSPVSVSVVTSAAEDRLKGMRPAMRSIGRQMMIEELHDAVVQSRFPSTTSKHMLTKHDASRVCLSVCWCRSHPCLAVNSVSATCTGRAVQSHKAILARAASRGNHCLQTTCSSDPSQRCPPIAAVAYLFDTFDTSSTDLNASSNSTHLHIHTFRRLLFFSFLLVSF